MKVLYFAWLRGRVGTGEETIVPPKGVSTVGQLLDWLATRSPGHAEALKDRTLVRVAVNQEFAGPDTPVAGGDEVALFPPMTGGGEAAFLAGSRAACDSTPSGVTRGGGKAAFLVGSRAKRGGGEAAFLVGSRAKRGGGEAAFLVGSRAKRGGGGAP
jgi:molybdopterin converting factor subunit 1